jgi:cyclopropane fatty-acyl-phospholipid synthase-like methyltransferase
MSVFDAKAADWDSSERRERARSVADAIRAHVGLEPDWRILDIGAGTGLLGLDLLPDVASVVLADPSEGMLDVARAKIEAAGISGASVIAFDVPASEPPAGAPFDLVVSMLALHHVEDTRATLASLLAMLAPGGGIALVDLDEEDGTFHDPDQPGIHHHGFHQDTLVDLAGAVGFVDARSRIVGELDRDGRTYPLFLLTGQRPRG